MIERRQEVLIGRDELTTEDNRPVREWLAAKLPRARWLWKFRYGAERKEEIETWSLARLRGRFLNWDRVGLEVWSGFGVAPLPHLVRSYFYLPLQDKVDLVEIKPAEAWLLHDAHEFPSPRQASYRLLTSALEQAGVLCDPRTNTRSGLDEVLAEAGLELVGWDLVPLTRRNFDRRPVPL
jgi:hypothetical protein